MYAFFYSIYSALLTGTWENITWSAAAIGTQGAFKSLLDFIANTIGGQWAEPITLPFSVDWVNLLTAILAITTYVIIATAVFGLVKKIFSIFFSGVR